MTTARLEKGKTTINTTYIAELQDKTAEAMVIGVCKAIKLPINTTKIVRADLRLEIYYEQEEKNVRPTRKSTSITQKDRERQEKRGIQKQGKRHTRRTME
jgi:hypothetical protein